ncbi:MAG: SDR family oxidoreductase [Burkholderiales bacterium]|nr:SDR family oxidoreductase [Burkholderiales bacterium]
MTDSAFNDKVVSVTGAAHGIGRATALAFARRGARLALGDVDLAGIEACAAEARAAGAAQAITVALDIADPAAVARFFSAIDAAFGRLDCAVNNAGIGEPAAPSFEEQSIENFDRVVGINVRGTWLCLREEIRRMKAQGGGAIVNLASAVAHVASPSPIYTLSKHAILGLTRSAALTHARLGIRVNAMCPGAIDTELTRGFMARGPEVRDRLLAAHPIGRLGTADEIAAGIVWLCSTDASFMTGQSLLMDGGYTAA